MLERTAAGLESGRLQRVLPRRIPSQRRLSTANVRHNDRLSPDKVTTTNSDEPIVTPSPFVDFLYPNLNISLLRRPSPSLCRPSTQLRNPRKHRCLSTATASSLKNDDIVDHTPILHRQTSNTFVAKESNDRAFDRKKWSVAEVPSSSSQSRVAFSATGTSDASVDEVADRALQELDRGSTSASDSTLQRLTALLGDQKGTNYLDVWSNYVRLSDPHKSLTRSRVLRYLSRSRGIVETGRALTLFQQTDIKAWDAEFLSAAILVFLRSNQLDTAIDIFETGLDVSGYFEGIEYILVETINRQDWARVLDIWLKYCKHVASTNSGTKPDLALLEPSMALPNLGALYFSLERYLDEDNGKVEKWMKATETSASALYALRRTFARAALRQPCPTKEAEVILDFWNKPQFYDRYLEKIFSLWYTKKVSNMEVRAVPSIYQKYRDLPDAKPSLHVLRGMFKIQYPTKEAGLQQVHDDWVKHWGELNLWGFNKYMKFHAWRGDVDTVFSLWNRCKKAFPAFGTQPHNFASTMNVFAQNGDVKGAENEKKRMVEEYNVQPDLDIWNTILKCYVRAGDRIRAMECFDEISTLFGADSFTYGQIIALAAKMGDLDMTIDLFRQAQAAKVEVTRELVLPVVLAYCLNDKLAEAEEIATLFAKQGVTSAAIWNQLISYNGMHGRLNKCYGLLRQMSTYKLEWDHETYSSILRALIAVKQVTAGFQVVRDAVKTKLHSLHAEHFAIVMLGAVKTGDRGIAESLMALMKQADIPVPFNAWVSYAQIVHDKTPNATDAVALRHEMLASIRRLVEQGDRDIRLRKEQTKAAGRALLVLVDYRDFASAEELMSLYFALHPQIKDGDPVPQTVITSMMLAYHRDGHYDKVRKLWQSAWPKILKHSRMSDGRIYPACQYEVTRLVFRLADTYRVQGDGQGLVKIVVQVLNYGFKLTSSTWDRLIRVLCDLGEWERAMEFMEKYLMPGWRGWEKPKKRPLIFLRQELNSRYLKPTVQAMEEIMRHWLEERKHAAWSVDVKRKLAHLEVKYPQVHVAFHRAPPEHITGPWVFRSDVNLVKAIDSILKPSSVAELKAMERALQRQLEKMVGRQAAKKSMGIKEAAESWFLRQMKNKTSAMSHHELQKLRVALRAMIQDKKDQPIELMTLDDGNDAKAQGADDVLDWYWKGEDS